MGADAVAAGGALPFFAEEVTVDRPTTKRVIFLLALVLSLAIGAGCRADLPAATPTAAPTATVAPTPPPTADSRAYQAVLDAAWETVNETYFEPDFGGVDWPAVRDRYRPRVAAAANDDEFYRLLNQMLWELNVSHLAAAPVDAWQFAEPVIWMEGKTGLDVRLLEGAAVVTRVEPGSPAAEAGLRPGFTLTGVDGKPVATIVDDAATRLAPPYNESGRSDGLTRALLSRIYGAPGTCVPLAWRDAGDALHEACVMRVRRERAVPPMAEALPPSHLAFTAQRLHGGIGYIGFNTFDPALMAEMTEAVQAMRDAPGIIIDLRGNPGGSIVPAEALAAQFVAEPTLLGATQSRQGARNWVLQPADEPYSGPLVILIDRLSFSASEWFTSSMQFIGRAVVVGLPSPGGLTGALLTPLPNGGLLMHPIVRMVTPDGESPEGRGVQPDVEVELAQDELLQGIDAQLEAAIAVIAAESAR